MLVFMAITCSYFSFYCIKDKKKVSNDLDNKNSLVSTIGVGGKYGDNKIEL